MRIISTPKFYDYYDSLASHDKDDLLYLRKQETIKFKSYTSHNWLWGNYSYYRNRFIVGFCGNVYMGYIFNPTQQLSPHNDIICYTLQDIDNFYSELDNKATHSYFIGEGGRKNRRPGRKEWEGRFKEVRKPNEEYMSKAPIYLKYDDKVILNPCLKDIEFYRVKNTIETYQELERYIGNHIPELPMPVISDKIMVEIKGFDKYSFRKDKSK